MAVKKRGLGRGLDALLGNNKTHADTKTDQSLERSVNSADGELRKLPVDLIQRGTQITLAGAGLVECSQLAQVTSHLAFHHFELVRALVQVGLREFQSLL